MINRSILRLAAAAIIFGILSLGALAQDDLYVPVGDQPEVFNWDSYEAFADEYDFEGQELEIFGPWTDRDQELVESVIDYFEAATGATVTYSGSGDAEQLIQVRVEGGDPPDIFVFPQPGLAADFASNGQLVPLGEESQQWVVDNYGAGEDWASFGTFADENGEDQFFIFPYKQDLKSLVWYIPDNFADAGYEVPETMEDLLALSQEMVDNGDTPWCLGIENGGATGWTATDWMEDIMLRLYPPETYDAWVSNELAFDSEEVINVMETFGTFVFSEGWINGGPESVSTTSFGDSPAGLFTIPPECFMHRQASFIPTFFPGIEDGDIELGVDVNAFYFPAFESEDLGNPVLGAGTLFGVFVESDVAMGFVEFLKTPIAHEIWMNQSGLLTAYQDANLDAYANDVLRSQGQVLLNADTFRFDASDLMPGAIGAGAFWTGMVDFVNGAPAEEVAAAIQEAWDNLDQ